MATLRIHGGRRVDNGRLIDRRPAGRAYSGVRFAYMHPVPSIWILLLGPVWVGLTR